MWAELQQKIQRISAAREENPILEKEYCRLLLELNRSQERKLRMSAEKRNLTMQLREQPKISARLREQNRLLHAILHSNQASFIWNLCSETTLQCMRCPAGWQEHNARCFYLSATEKDLGKARLDCFDYGGDLAVVSDAKDQDFLTNLTLDFVRENPDNEFLGAWIGLTDLTLEGSFQWVNASKLNENATYWHSRPNNKTESDKTLAGEGCVIIRPLKKTGWERLHTWEDLNCWERRHYFCETAVLILPQVT